jgi:putative hydrolase of the HAD superfamily
LNISHIFFDLDRTLWDFDVNSQKTLLDIYNEYSLNVRGVKSFDLFLKHYLKINESLWDLYRQDLISKDDLRSKRFDLTLNKFSINNNELASEIGNTYVSKSPLQTSLFPYTKDVLSYLKEKYSLSIITNGFDEVQKIKLKASGLDTFFDTVVTSDFVNVKKPNPIIFKYALDINNVSAENSIMIGDDLLVDIIGAKDVGFSQIYFNPNNIPHNKICDYEIRSLSEIKNIL